MYVLEAGGQTDEILQNLQQRRVAFVAGRIAQQDPLRAGQFVVDLASEGLIDPSFAHSLLRSASVDDDYRPGTYL